MARHKTLQVEHPDSGKVHEVRVPADHDGSRVKVEFPDGATTYTEGWDPAERALEGPRPVIECPACGASQTVVSGAWTCSACGERIELRAAAEGGAASDRS